jgi:Zn-dependent peptidase ImmA (M78 family)
MLDPEDKVIWVDRGEARRSPRRKRFTIAHEIGHFRMHVPQLGGVFADRPQDILEISGNRAKTPGLPQREHEANAFARELLMPELLVSEHANATGFNLSALAERFDVSVPAIRLRLRLLGLLPKYMT